MSLLNTENVPNAEVYSLLMYFNDVNLTLSLGLELILAGIVADLHS